MMQKPKPLSEPSIDIEAASQAEQDRRLVAHDDTDTVKIDALRDTVRMVRTPRAETTRRELLRQPWIQD